MKYSLGFHQSQQSNDRLAVVLLLFVVPGSSPPCRSFHRCLALLLHLLSTWPISWLCALNRLFSSRLDLPSKFSTQYGLC